MTKPRRGFIPGLILGLILGSALTIVAQNLWGTTPVDAQVERMMRGGE